MLSAINKKDLALYINFPFCHSPCSYCHYVDNLSFGFQCIPDTYFSTLCQQLHTTCSQIRGVRLKSIYMGGGTPSLMSDEQLLAIQQIIRLYKITADEVSIELHPAECNFNYQSNSFITRYSIGVQSFEPQYLEHYHRARYSLKDIRQIFRVLRANPACRTINLDLIFQEYLDCKFAMKEIESLGPDTVTVYPDTHGRGKERLERVIRTLDQMRIALKNYHPMYRSRFIFVRNQASTSLYAKLQCETMGDIIGLGHNSVSSIGSSTYLCRFEEGFSVPVYHKRENKGNRFIAGALAGLPTGLPLESVHRTIPDLLTGHYLHTVEGDFDLNEKHTQISEHEMVYLPMEEYVRFFQSVLINYDPLYRNIFLGEIGFGDSNAERVLDVYNTFLFLPEQEWEELSAILGQKNVQRKKLPMPEKYILIEGIDGSGKDTFAKFLCDELKKRFIFAEDSRISVTGQPNSTLPGGKLAKHFVEDLTCEDLQAVIMAMRENRIASEQQLLHMPGTKILIRGIGTDEGTLNYVAPGQKFDLGQGRQIKHWDYLIVVDVEVSVANERITLRGLPRTWREHTEPLNYFRNYYLNYQSDLFRIKLVIKNRDLSILSEYVRKLANELYVDQFKRYIQ